ncbi:hypothetical protein [Pseudomonas syringae pv. coryli]|uniref:hypothetical protein n=1 Tax=Pseudomonas syringae pv. coryli TaxID=317659 RepID=UPI003D26DB32
MNRLTVGLLLGLAAGLPGGAAVYAQFSDSNAPISVGRAQPDFVESAEDYVSNRVICQSGTAAVMTADTRTFVQIEVPPQSDDALPVVCGAFGGYELNGQPLSIPDLARYAKATRDIAVAYQRRSRSSSGGIPVIDWSAVEANRKAANGN